MSITRSHLRAFNELVLILSDRGFRCSDKTSLKDVTEAAIRHNLVVREFVEQGGLTKDGWGEEFVLDISSNDGITTLTIGHRDRVKYGATTKLNEKTGKVLEQEVWFGR